MVDKSCIRTAKNSRTTPTLSPSEGAPSGVSYVFVGRHGIETVSGASRLLLDLSGRAPLLLLDHPLVVAMLALQPPVSPRPLGSELSHLYMPTKQGLREAIPFHRVTLVARQLPSRN